VYYSNKDSVPSQLLVMPKGYIQQPEAYIVVPKSWQGELAL